MTPPLGPPPNEPRVLGKSGGIVIAEIGDRVMVVDQGIGGLSIARFVLGLLGFIMAAQGVVFGVLGLRDPRFPPLLAVLLVAVAAPVLIGAVTTHRMIRRRRTEPLTRRTPTATFDRASGVVTDGHGNVLGRLDQVRIQRQLNVTSSSPMLVAVFPGRTLTLGRPNPFSGGFGRLDHQLVAALWPARPRD